LARKAFMLAGGVRPRPHIQLFCTLVFTSRYCDYLWWSSRSSSP